MYCCKVVLGTDFVMNAEDSDVGAVQHNSEVKVRQMTPAFPSNLSGNKCFRFEQDT